MIKYSGKDKFKKKVAEILNNGSLGTKPNWEDIQEKPNTFPPSEHNHDGRYFTEDEINELMKDKADSDHNHDERYNTKDELASLLDGKLSTTLKGTAGGLAELDENGKVPASQLPSYVDDVIEGYYYENYFYEDAEHTLMIVGEAGKIYIDLITNKTYRWSGSIFTVISETLALGETSSTAYRGDRGKTAYEHSQIAHAPADAQKNVQSDWNATSGDAYIKNKPTEFPPSSHTHDDRYYTETEVDNLLGGKASSSHTHDDRYYTESEVNTLLGNKSDTGHTHDDRYYTETEVNNLIADHQWVNYAAKSGYASTSDYATESNVTDEMYDYNDSSRRIRLGYAGAGLTTSNLSHIAGYTDGGTKIKDVSKDVLKSWLGSLPANGGNADTVDGYHESSFLRFRDGVSSNGTGTLWGQIGIRQYNGALPDGLSGAYNWGHVVSLPSPNSRLDFYSNDKASDSSDSLYFRTGWDSNKRSWRKLIYSKDNEVYAIEEYNNAFIMYTTNNGARYVNTGAWSDSRLKENIKNTDIKGLEVINQIVHKQFDWKNKEKFGKHVDIGYIAHEMKAVIPEAVVDIPQNNFEGYDSLYQIDSLKLVPYMTKAIQELSEKIVQLEAEIKELKSSIN